jgi:demethylmenaquinone methyltransferase/2-methoxy-6-polyprenyl-1,4-benzoquinol methylase
MLSTAPEKARRAGLDVKFEIADATKLAYSDDSFDVTSISFGIRNVHDPIKAVSEMARVTRNGGRVMILETGRAVNPLFRAAFGFYFSSIMPRIAGLLGGDPGAYRYLQQSSANFPSGEAFLEIMRQGGSFSTLEAVPLFGGVSWLYRGVVQK